MEEKREKKWLGVPTEETERGISKRREREEYRREERDRNIEEKRREKSPEGKPYPKIHQHSTTVVNSGLHIVDEGVNGPQPTGHHAAYVLKDKYGVCQGRRKRGKGEGREWAWAWA